MTQIFTLYLFVKGLARFFYMPYFTIRGKAIHSSILIMWNTYFYREKNAFEILYSRNSLAAKWLGLSIVTARARSSPDWGTKIL